eukprot:scaffold58311_cov20-Tisochrysis_lutea.AAC.1
MQGVFTQWRALQVVLKMLGNAHLLTQGAPHALQVTTGSMMSELIPSALGRCQPVVFLSGPSFAKEASHVCTRRVFIQSCVPRRILWPCQQMHNTLMLPHILVLEKQPTGLVAASTDLQLANTVQELIIGKPAALPH